MKERKPELLRCGALDIQVCVPESWTDQQVVAFANGLNPSGTSLGWTIRRSGDDALSGDPERNPCSEKEQYVHIVLDA